MMENTGRNMATFITSNMGLTPRNTRVLIMVGSGGNGGGAMVAARHLSNMGFEVDVVLSTEIENLDGVIKLQADILTKLPIGIYQKSFPHNKYTLIIDGIIGYSLKGEPRGFAKEMINYCNKSTSTVVSLDNPSGLDLNEINKNKFIVKADYTITLALPKLGLSTDYAKKFVGKLYLANISVPPSLYLRMGLKVSDEIFENGYLLEL